MRLILFDIDGTLLRDGGAAREAYAVALLEVFGHQRSLKTYDFSGLTDPQITHIVLGDAGFAREVIEEGMAQLWTAYLRELEARTVRERVQLMPGVIELLDRLAAESDVSLGLLTGNIEEGARIKLGAWDLNRFFRFGAFGSDSPDRYQLPPIAIRRAHEHLGCSVGGRDVVIIGDSIHDVRCAIPYGATSIAVATGPTPKDTLAAESPDHLFDTLESCPEVLSSILGI